MGRDNINTHSFHFTSGKITLVFDQDGSHLRLLSFGSETVSWLSKDQPSGLFLVLTRDRPFDMTSMAFGGVEEAAAPAGITHLVLDFQEHGLSVHQHILLYEGSSVIECWPVITNTGSQPVNISRIDSLSLMLQAGQAELFSFTGNWGSEFEPHQHLLNSETILQSRSGRSSKGDHPWFALSKEGKGVFSGSVAWSGNWIFRFQPARAGSFRLSGGLNDWEFSKELQPGESIEGAPVVLVQGNNLNAVSQQYAHVGREHWYPRNRLSERLPIEWNHWWPYEDVEINEAVFKANVLEAEKMGFEVCTLDAGWFGPSDPGTFWEHYRGDWHLVNNRRFPSGIRHLADFTHAHGMKFGIWCEIEGLGNHAQVAKDHPDYVALRDGERIGCVCFGNPQVQEWAYHTLSRLITEYGADWIKVDYNLDQGAGCNRPDHGHRSGDGQYEHYRGYYRTLERIRADFPQVVLENCSSGGLRIDLGMLRRTYMTFLSDPDWPVHDLQIFWGASTMLAPDVLLHWPFGDWRNTNPPPQQNFNPHDPALTQKKLDYYIRISMLGLYGQSQKLPNLPEWVAKRMAYHNSVYKNEVRRFVKEADLYRLTGQPRRSGEGERWTAFQYSLPAGDAHLLFVFRLPGAEPARTIHLQGLEPGREYTVQALEGDPLLLMKGKELMEKGLPLSGLEEEESVLLKIS